MAVQIVKPRIRGLSVRMHILLVSSQHSKPDRINKRERFPQRHRCERACRRCFNGLWSCFPHCIDMGIRAKTLGLLYERPADARRTASAGYYNTFAFHQQAQEDGFYAESINGDAFSDKVKQETIEQLKANFGKVDVLVYSIAAPRRTHPRTGETHNSELKPIGETYTGKQ